MARTDRISGDKTAILLARLTAGDTMREAARAANLTERTAYRKLAADPELKRDLVARRRQLVDAVSTRLADMGDDALDVLGEIMADASTPAPTRLTAARYVLQHLAQLSELAEAADVDARLQKIEDVLDRITRPRGAAA